MKSILFKRIDISEDQFKDLVYAMRDYSFNFETGEGIQIIDEQIDYVKCLFCYETIHFQNTYNPETKEFDKMEFKRIELIPFIIDLQFSTLDIMGNKQKSSKVIDLIGKLTKYRCAIGDVGINPIKTLLQCTKNGIRYSISRVKITDYVFFDNIVGNCVLNLNNYEKTDDLLRKYEKQIVNFTASLSLDETYVITFYRSGAISLYKELEDVDIELLRAIKLGM